MRIDLLTLLAVANLLAKSRGATSDGAGRSRVPNSAIDDVGVVRNRRVVATARAVRLSQQIFPAGMGWLLKDIVAPARPAA